MCFEGGRNCYVAKLTLFCALELKQGKLFDAPPPPKKPSTGDVKESFFIGRLDDEACNLNQWPSEGMLCHHVRLSACQSSHSFYSSMDLSEHICF